MAKLSVRNKKKTAWRKPTIICLCLLIVLGVLLLTLEKTNVTSLLPGTQQPEPTGSVNNSSINYSPATDTDNEDINAKKEDGSLLLEPSIPNSDTSVQIIFIASNQDMAGGPLVIRTQLQGVNDGSCELELTSAGRQAIIKTASVIRQNNYFVCDGFDVPKSELVNGVWGIRLTLTTGDGRQNEATTQTTVK